MINEKTVRRRRVLPLNEGGPRSIFISRCRIDLILVIIMTGGLGHSHKDGKIKIININLPTQLGNNDIDEVGSNTANRLFIIFNT